MTLNVDLEAVADYLGFEETDPMINRNIARMIPAADRFLQSAIGDDYDRDDPRAQQLAVMVVAELYDTRGVMSAKQEAQLRRIAAEFIAQMRLEGRE